MLSYTKLSGNARRFKTLMGMSLQEFDLLFAKVEKAHPEAWRERLSKRPRRRAIGAGRIAKSISLCRALTSTY